MIQTTIGDIIGPLIEWTTYWGTNLLTFLVVIFSNPMIAGAIIFYIVIRFAIWYIRREKEKKEMEYLQKPSYEVLETRNVELTEEIRDMRRRLRRRAFKD